MAWTTLANQATGDLITATIWNNLFGTSGNLSDLSTHTHSGSAGQGSTSLGNLVQVDFTTAAAPAAPGASLGRRHAGLTAPFSAGVVETVVLSSHGCQ